jgi:tRNA A-37 threonylcarbamoyl transferase component Bud32
MNSKTTGMAAQSLTLTLPDQHGGAAQVQCAQALRVVANKRASYLARWNDQTVFLKLFMDRRRGRRHWQREKTGMEAVAARGILAPRLLYAGFLRRHNGYVLISEALIGGHTLAEEWMSGGSTERGIALLRSAVETLALQHQAGIVQADLHLGNFMRAENRVYTIDPSKLRIYDGPVTRPRALCNLGLLLAQVEPRYDAHAAELLDAYAATRRWCATENDCVRLQAYIDQSRSRRKGRYLKKVFRECTAYACKRRRTGRLVYDKRYATRGFERLYRDPESAFAGEGVRFLKRGNTATLVATRIDGVDVVIKRYNVKSVWHGVRRALKRTRASISWENAQLLRFYGICTPRPIAFIEQRLGTATRVSYFVSQHLHGLTLREFFQQHPASSAEGRLLVKTIADTFAILARYHIRHGDMKATNIIVSDNLSCLVDLDALRSYRSKTAFRRAQRRDLKRFLENWRSQPDVHELFANSLAGHGAGGS